MTEVDTGGEKGPPGDWATGSGDYRPSQTIIWTVYKRTIVIMLHKTVPALKQGLQYYFADIISIIGLANKCQQISGITVSKVTSSYCLFCTTNSPKHITFTWYEKKKQETFTFKKLKPAKVLNVWFINGWEFVIKMTAYIFYDDQLID